MSKRPFVLFAIACGIAALLWYDRREEAAVPPVQRPPSAPARQVKSGPPLPHPVAVDSAQLRETVTRPLFEPSRRPPAPPEFQAAAPPPQSTQPAQTTLIDPTTLRVTGIILSSSRTGEGSIALIGLPGETTSRRLAVGDSIGGWQIVKLDHDRAHVSGQGQTATLPLRARTTSGIATGTAEPAPDQPDPPRQ